MGHREENLKQLSVRDLGWVVDDLNGLGVARVAFTDPFVMRGFGFAAGETGRYAQHAVQTLEYCLHAPEASAGEYRRCGLPARVRGQIDGRSRKTHGAEAGSGQTG